MNQPPIDNAHVSPGCEPFTSAGDYQPTDPVRLAIRRGLTKFASSDAKLCDVENEIVTAIESNVKETELFAALFALMNYFEVHTMDTGRTARGEQVFQDAKTAVFNATHKHPFTA